MQVRGRTTTVQLSELSESEWWSYLKDQDCFSFFVTPRFYGAWIQEQRKQKYGLFALTIQKCGGSLLIPLVEEHGATRRGGRALFGAPEWAYAVSGTRGYVLGNEEAAKVQQLLTKQGVARLTFHCTPLQNMDLGTLSQFGWSKRTFDTYVVPIAEGREVWYESRIDKNVRKQIQKSLTAGLITKRCGVEKLEEFYTLYKQQSEGRTVRYTYAFLRNLFSSNEPCEARLYLTYKDDSLAAGGLLLIGRGQAVAWIGAMNRQMSKLCPNENRHFFVIGELAAEGIHYYNLGACPNLPGVAQFKVKLGAEPVECGVYEFLRTSRWTFARKWIKAAACALGRRRKQ